MDGCSRCVPDRDCRTSTPGSFRRCAKPARCRQPGHHGSRPMNTTRLFVLLVVVGSCGIAGSSFQHVKLAHLGFDISGDWHNADSHQRGRVTSVWTPDGNERKESVTVIRTERSPAVANAGPATLES